MSIGDFPESLSQAMLVGVMLVGQLGVRIRIATHTAEVQTNQTPEDEVASPLRHSPI